MFQAKKLRTEKFFRTPNKTRLSSTLCNKTPEKLIYRQPKCNSWLIATANGFPGFGLGTGFQNLTDNAETLDFENLYPIKAVKKRRHSH